MFNKEAARNLIDLLIRHGGELDRHLQDVQPLCSADEFDAHKLLVGRLMGSILLDGLNVLVAEFPELKPSQLE